MNDCVHYDGNPHDCSIFGIACKVPRIGCYLPIAKRDEMLNRCRGIVGEESEIFRGDH
jgi:hypothetical protein